MAITYSDALQNHHAGDSRPAGLMRFFAFLRGRVAPLPRDDRGFVGPAFSQLVPDLAVEIARHSN